MVQDAWGIPPRFPDARGFFAAATQLDVAKRLCVLTDRQLAAVAHLLGEELEDAVRICRGIPQRNQVGEDPGLDPAQGIGSAAAAAPAEWTRPEAPFSSSRW